MSPPGGPTVRERRLDPARAEPSDPARAEPVEAPVVPESPLHKPALHESALRHVTGEALYVDDLPEPPGTLVAWLVTSPHASASILRRDGEEARSVPGVHAVLFASDIPGENDAGAVVHDEPVLAKDRAMFLGHPVALVVGESYAACRAAAEKVKIEYAPEPAILTIEDAIARGSFLCEPHVIRRGAVEQALASAALRFEGEVKSPSQEHFYLETHASLAIPEEGGMRVLSSTQHPSEVQAIVARVLGIGRHQVTVEVPRMGGGFGGKESQGAMYAAMAALGAARTRHPVKVRLDRDRDMAITGKRHPSHSRFEAGFSSDGRILALKAALYLDGGWATDLSRAILDRAVFHIDGAYYVPAVELRGQAVRTNLPSNTAFRGFGGPQGMILIEEVMSRAAERLGMDGAELRRKNFYGAAPRDETPYGQKVTDNRLERICERLLSTSDYARRREEIARFNAQAGRVKRGIAFQPVKFGISFTTSFLNQAGALVNVYADGTVQLNHGGTEMGQGLHTKMLAVCAHELGVPVEKIRVMPTATDKVPNTVPTAASSGSDLNGQAVKAACEQIRERLRPIAAKLLGVDEAKGERIVFAAGKVHVEGRPENAIPFGAVTQAAYLAQVSMSATGYYFTPDIHYDRVAGRGKPFHYYAFCAAVVEVEVSGWTGEHRILRADILQDTGDSLVPSIDKGQVEGGFVQGAGWLTCEELLFDSRGALLTRSPDTYKIPAIGDAPVDFRVELLEGATQSNVIHGSKAVGEPPLMLAIGVVSALRQAVAAFGASGREVQLSIPCTPEAVLWAIEAAATSGGADLAAH